MAERSLFASGFCDPSDYSGDIGISHIPRGMIGAGDVKMAALFTAWLGFGMV